MTRLIVVLFCMLIAACSTGGSHQVDTPIDKNKYVFLWEKDLQDGCAAAFHSESLLYLVTKERNSGNLIYVSVYDPRTSIFATVPLYYRGSESCRNVSFSILPTQSIARLSYIESPEFRIIFDNFSNNPEALKMAINAGPVYFRYDGQWNGKRSALNLDRMNIKDIKSVADVSSYLKSLSNESAIAMIGARKAFIATKEAEAQERKIRTKQARDGWDNRMSKQLGVGDKVCTFDNNMFGFVENISGEKVKVHVVGRATPAFAMSGYFFSGVEGRFQYTPIESIRWFVRGELAHCYFE